MRAHPREMKMAEESDASLEAGSRKRLILSSLTFTSFVTGTPGILTGLLLIDIGMTFGVPVGIMGQVHTASSIVAFISALLVGALSVRFRHKSLLWYGLLCILVSALGCAFSQSYLMMLLFYPLTGFGMSFTGTMSMTLIAEYFSLEGRSKAVSWYIAGGSLAYLIGSLVITFLSGTGGWRLAYTGFVIPATIIGLILTYFGLPSTPQSPTDRLNVGGFMEGYKAVLLNKSAVACQWGTILRTASFQMVLLYGVSFFRQQFELSIGGSSLLVTSVALCYTAGSLSTSRLVGRFGRKGLTVITSSLAGLFTLLMTITPSFWVAITMDIISCLFFGMSASAASSLNLEQVPEYRSFMMSLGSATGSVGAALGAGLGGFILLGYGYGMVGVILGALGILSAIIIFRAAVDHTAQRKA
jgi:DHA1 family inner membrane transport protein